MTRQRLSLFSLSLVLVGAALVTLAVQQASAAARGAAETEPAAQASPLHPTFPLLDEGSQNVLDSGGAVSTMRTCGQCHDTAFVAQHNFHADLGLSELAAPGQTGSGRAWDASPGPFGKWDPLTYRYLSAPGDERLDLGTADWVRLFGERHVGGGPATTSRAGLPLSDLEARTGGVETTILDPATGQPVAWDWGKSGTVELNCFICHLSNPDDAERIAAIRAGEFRWASTATLAGANVVSRADGGWEWNRAAFDANGELLRAALEIQDPSNANCAQCHGAASDSQEPLALAGVDLKNWQTATTGQVVSPQRISESGLNLADKADLTRSWDVHAERGLQCADCHYSLNNPALAQTSGDSLEHLAFDPRRLEIGEFLQRPDHNLARGQSAQNTLAPELKDTMRRCEGCHAAPAAHDWLPYVERHMAELACESCHIPQLYAPAIQAYDWTVLTTDGQPRKEYRGVQGNTGALQDLVTGFQPALLQRQNVDGETLLAPYNLITAWYWVYDSAQGERPVRLADLQAAWLTDGQYAGEVLAVFDADHDGALNEAELKLDAPAKQTLIANRLSALGLQNPRIVGEVQPYSLNHNISRGEWAVKDCQACHASTSRLAQPMQLASFVPGGVTPRFVKDANTAANGALYDEAGALYYRPSTQAQQLYVFGHDRVGWVDWLGALAFVGVLAAISAHGGLRFYASLRGPRHKAPARRVYMYAVYERFWHWLQTFAIVLLLLTGLVIHRPDVFGLFSFPHVVIVHNVLAAILVINAALSLFYHLASGEIRQFLPRPYGFFDQAIVQARFYLQGIFRGDPHPFEKTPQKKMNPLQQLTYFGILNVLLPLQVITGALMWGVQRWPQAANWFGGLPFLAPFHSLIAWLFAAFIAAHVYLTTTGHEPTAGVKAMMLGWEEVEDPAVMIEELPHDHTHASKDGGKHAAPESEGVAV